MKLSERIASLFWPPAAAARSMSGWAEWEAGGPSPGSRQDATHLVPFFGAVRHIVDFMSTLPVDAYRKDGDSRVRAPLPRLVTRLDEPGDIGFGQWVGQWAYGQAVHGNSVGWVTATDGFGFPIAIRWLNRSDWSLNETTKMWTIYGEQVPYGSSRIVHSPWIVPAGCILGVSPLDHFRTFWQAGRSAQEYADLSRGGGLPPATLKNTAKTLDAAVAQRIQARAAKSFASGLPFVTGSDWELNVTAVPPNQAQFLATMQFTANQTAAIFGIDPREIGGSATESLTYATDESRSLNRANNMRPYLVRFEQLIARMLPERQYLRLNVDATIRTDIKTRTEVIGAQLKDGRLNLDEARALEDRPPLPNGQGQAYNIPRPNGAPVIRNGDEP
ncbi:phage portal protein [Antribacter gilvus]|uniref:phage portal protein n=1 Tax=Antribacter gilvus TaxID=2304675 RepID=UPI000F766C2B|nr:phage portal protein [Antribacter gilvus]